MFPMACAQRQRKAIKSKMLLPLMMSGSKRRWDAVLRHDKDRQRGGGGGGR